MGIAKVILFIEDAETSMHTAEKFSVRCSDVEIRKEKEKAPDKVQEHDAGIVDNVDLKAAMRTKNAAENLVEKISGPLGDHAELLLDLTFVFLIGN